MINEKYGIAICETLHYLNGINQKDLNKIPRKFMQFLNDNCLKDYKCNFDYTKPLKECHFAPFPQELVETPIKASCPKGGIVIDPFMGSGTSGLVAKKLGRHYIGVEINSDFIKLANKRIDEEN